jgi:hypothetical protein
MPRIIIEAEMTTNGWIGSVTGGPGGGRFEGVQDFETVVEVMREKVAKILAPPPAAKAAAQPTTTESTTTEPPPPPPGPAPRMVRGQRRTNQRPAEPFFTDPAGSTGRVR